MSKTEDPMLVRIRGAVRPMVMNQRLTDDAQQAAANVAGCTDVLDAMKGLAGLLLVMEDAEACVKQTASSVRAVLAEAMEDTSATTLRLPSHTISLADGKPGFIVTDTDVIPPTLMRQADPVPDRNAIQKLLNSGKDVPGVVRKNSAPYVQIRAHQGATA